MSIKYYKLVGYDPFWTKIDNKYPREHIETILENVSYSHKKFASKKARNESHWQPIKNVQWAGINDCTITAYQDEIPNYIKIDNNGIIYYYYLLDTPMVLASLNGKSQYRATYQLDTYMTIWWNKLEIMREHNPSVYCNKGFFNRWAEREEENTLYYFFDYIASKWIGQTQTDRNNQLIRKLAYYTTAQDIYSLNFPNTTIPSTYEVEQFDNPSSKWNITDFNTKLTSPNSRGRYLYFVAKSTAKMTTSNEKLVNNHTNQKFILIPFFNDMEEDFWHGLNDFDVTKTGSFLVPQGDNEIGLYECDIPYSIFYGYLANNQYGTTLKYANQPMSNESNIKIPFFEIDNNAPILLKIIDYNRYKQGFSGKFDYLVRNIYDWIPDTEPAFLNPMYYKEIYKIGDSQIIVDASMFYYKWSADEVKNFGVEAYLSFSSGLNIAYNFGENTNTALSTFDNTETVNGTISISNMYMGSNSANYFTTNASTLATSLVNRKSEETQAWVDAGLDTAKAWTRVAPSNIFQAINPFFYAKRAASAALETSKIMTDTTMQQQRANREFMSSVNNVTSAPSQTLANADVKGVIPNKHGLFETYSLELHPYDRDVLFSNYTHTGYPYNAICKFNDIANNRQIMNVINLNTTYFEDDLLLLLTQYDNSLFNTKFWNTQFLAWLNNSINIYNTRTFVNCTDYLGDNYVSNIETALPYIPVPKTYIGNFITKFRITYTKDTPEGIMEILKKDNPNAPSDIWQDIEILQIEIGGFIIATKQTSVNYYGNIVVSATIEIGLHFIAEQDNSSIGYRITGQLSNINMQVSYDGVNWYDWDGRNINLNLDDEIWVRNTTVRLSWSTSDYLNFIMTGKISANGNIMSLLNYITYISASHPAFYRLFYNCSSLTTAPELPATNLTNQCYSSMFANCTSLTTAPELPSLIVSNSCYTYMFYGCTSLTTAPELPATTLAQYCYNSMFSGCTSLNISENSGSNLVCDFTNVELYGGEWVQLMFYNTGGSFTGTPTNNKYYWN